LEEISAYLSSSLLATVSAAEPAQADVALRCEAATVSVTVTSQVAQRPSFHGVSVRPSGRYYYYFFMALGTQFPGAKKLRKFL